MKEEISYYKILGVNETASNYELRKAFCKLSIELHPDTTSLDLEDAKNKFQKVLEAYENLNNPDLRRIYDEKLKEISIKPNFNSTNIVNTLAMDTNNQELVGNRRPFSNGEIFSLFLLILIIFLSLSLSIVIASITGKEIDSIPTWLIK